MNAKIFNLMSRMNETRFLVQHELCESKCRLNESVCNSKQKWNYDEYWCEFKELGDWGQCKKGYLWNPSACNYKSNLKHVKLMNTWILKSVLAKTF